MRLGQCKPGLEATKNPMLSDIAWAAGLYEGEGSCHYHPRGTAHIEIAQKGTEILHWMKELFGGRVTTLSSSASPNQIHRWVATGARARGFALTIYTWLSSRRRRQVEKMLEEG
ncbi:hypothetical protein LCGC14_1226630 [marine sediment metagenome]|uniref:Homing endonuclease LAGLIDADG domain-containing protein n=1 Tax=marine sediment metagenome TaxID=412755 RepID=A0A0F9L9P7_9ZZZZ